MNNDASKDSFLNKVQLQYHGIIKPLKLLLINNKAKAGFVILVGMIIFSVLGQFFAPYNPNKYEFARSAPPTYAHLLGTTVYGQDVFSQLFYGAAPTLLVGFAVGFMGTFISIFVGISAGFASERVNNIVSGVINIFLIIPGVLLIMLFGSYFLGIHESLGYLPTILILVITGWAFGARTFRSITLSIAKRDFILSSMLIGESRLSIIFRQIIRAIFPVIVSNFFFTAMYGTLGLTFVEYLGVGNLLQINWGTMLYWAINNEAYLTGLWWWILPPSFMISILMFSFILLNFGMDEIGNPSLRRFDSKKNKKGEINEYTEN
ncbi:MULTISPECIES: ABC transporter permease [Ferroplasma]|jgi:peptide/nickel transport system permease protein|uniref:ABC transmembrane type-1 domain-containing protein n=1 Tax=Ferroplasma acidarmanus Fer1 TaxID=333146 RepID=S0APX7_FERAC|nr:MULTISPECIES: ABC transporter permease [Ferroplasma]AGO60120.1 hypothetical protein FACI_IFERC00001G0140 [Ferroplasma acidarmanus Fer1]